MFYVAAKAASELHLSSISFAFAVNKRMNVIGETTEKGGACS